MDFEFELKEEPREQKPTPRDFETKAPRDPNLITFIEIYFWEKGALPPRSLLALKKLCKADYDLTELNEALTNRGLPEYSTPPEINLDINGNEKAANTSQELEGVGKNQQAVEIEGLELEFIPDPKAILAANVVLNVSDKRSLAAKLKAVGITVAQWNAFLADPEFANYVKHRANKLSDQFSLNAKLGLGSLIGSGDLNAIKYWHEFSGEYKPNQEEILNLKMIISLLMEILVNYVEPQRLPALANELESALPFSLKEAN